MPSAPSFDIFFGGAVLKYGKFARYKAIALVSAPVNNKAERIEIYFTDLTEECGGGMYLFGRTYICTLPNHPV